MDRIVEIATENAAKQGRAPEEEDFLTAAVTHQHLLSRQERSYLQQDLASIENAVTTDEEFGFEEDTEDENYRCEICGCTYRCFCKEEVEVETESVEMPSSILVTAGCPNLNWFGESYVAEDKVEETKKAFEKIHAEKCGCSELLIGY